jgi:hypothetical protein
MGSTKSSIVQYKSYIILACLFLLLQLILGSFTLENSGMANILWYLDLIDVIVENGLFHTWTPYPPLFAVFLYGMSLFVGSMSFVLFWKLLNVMLVLGISFFLYKMLEQRDKNAALLAAFGYVLIHLTWKSTVTIGWYFDQFDYIPIFFMVGALYLLQQHKRTISAILCGLGIMTKLFPVVVLLVALFRGSIKERMRYVAIVFFVCLLVMLPFFLVDSSTLTSWLDFSGSRDAWETVWHYPAELFPPIPEVASFSAAFISDENPYLWLMLLTVVSMLGYMWWQKKRETSVTVERVVLVLLLLLLIFAKGISSYFIFWLFPLIFLCYKSKYAFTICAVLLVIVNLEFWWYWESIFLRHGVFIGVLVHQILDQHINKVSISY